MAVKQRVESIPGRLQREPGVNGFRLNSFKGIVKRHGLLVLSLAILCLFVPNAFDTLSWSMYRFTSNSVTYFSAAFLLLIFILIYSYRAIGGINSRQLLWVTYLLGVSILEEWIFRLVIPYFLGGYFPFILGVVLSNFIFAALHYVSLRWRLRMCMHTFVGAMLLSQLMTKGDIFLVIGVHWFFTFLNTPRPPRKIEYSSNHMVSNLNVTPL